MPKKLPIGIQTFSELIERDCLYVDKTRGIHELLATGKYFFLSRPRRFGKSLLLSTIAAIYSGKKELFKGLWIEQNRDWDQTHPVIHLSVNQLDYQGLGLDKALQQALHEQAARYELTLEGTTIKTLFSGLIRDLAGQHGKVVLLIDEYDKPLIDYLDAVEQAQANQALMKTFYSVIKDSDPYIEFMLITGVSKFSRVSIFSDLNNLYDLTLDRRTASLIGYTQGELEHYFAPYLPATETFLQMERPVLLAKIRDWYNGYSWDLQTRLYNPYSILSFFQAQAFRNFWFESGTPTFLPRLMRKQGVYRLDNQPVTELALGNFDLEQLQVTPVLFQTGYLTLATRNKHDLYQLDYPNHEVRASMLTYLMAEWAHEQPANTTPLVTQLHEAFEHNDAGAVIDIIRHLFKRIPHQIFLKEREAYYHSLIYLTFFYLGQYTQAEVSDNTGRIDCVVQTAQHIFILEFKLDESAAAAMQQIHSKGYADSYKADPRQKVLLGINFSSEQKNVDDWLIEYI